MMRRFKGENTQPEITVRRALHRLGFRFRLHRRDLPGTPDIVLPRWRTAIFVHGCFWHQHEGCRTARVPGTRTEFWVEKFQRNRQRDAEVTARLALAGWHQVVIWECEAKSAALAARLLNAIPAASGLFSEGHDSTTMSQRPAATAPRPPARRCRSPKPERKAGQASWHSEAD